MCLAEVLWSLPAVVCHRVPGSVLPGGLNFDIAKTPFLTAIFPGEREFSSKISFCFCFAQFFSAAGVISYRGLPCFGVPHLQERFALRDTACLLGDNFRRSARCNNL